jgi:hypothetical protein
LKWISEGDLRHIINPVTKRGEENEKESSQPKGPAFSTEQENHTDDSGRNAQRVNNPSILNRIAIEEGFAQRKVNDQYDLEQERPSDKKFIEIIQFHRLNLLLFHIPGCIQPGSRGQFLPHAVDHDEHKHGDIIFSAASTNQSSPGKNAKAVLAAAWANPATRMLPLLRL